MASRRINPDEPKRTRRAPATTPEGRENQMVALATDLAEKQILDGTASSQVLTHYLKLGTMQYRAELRKMELDAQYKEKQIEELGTAKRVEELYEGAINAMRRYSGDPEPMQDFDD